MVGSNEMGTGAEWWHRACTLTPGHFALCSLDDRTTALETVSESESAMVKKLSKVPRTKASGVTKRLRKPEILDEEERILREATKHLVFKHGMFLVATGI